MNFTRLELPAADLQSLAWHGDALIDWVGGGYYPLASSPEKLNLGYSYRFDAAVGLSHWGVSFEALGTKGRLLKDNGQRPSGNFVPLAVDVVREINRSCYHAADYLYPVVLFFLPDGRPVLAHCPRGYNVLDLEDLNGHCLTPRSIEGADDVFHSRLDASADGHWLLSNGWVWHPFRIACVYDVARALNDPSYLSTNGEAWLIGNGWEWEVDGATFAGHRLVCVTNEEKNLLAIYDLDVRRHERTVELVEPPGTRLMAFGNDHIVLFDGHPRVLDLATGVVVEKWVDLDGGKGIHQPSVAMESPTPPWIATDPLRKRFALGWPDRIVIVTLCND